MIQGMCNLKYPPALYIRKWSNLDYRDTRSGRERNPKNSSGVPTSSSQNWIRCGISSTCCTRTMTWPLMSRSMGKLAYGDYLYRVPTHPECLGRHHDFYSVASDIKKRHPSRPKTEKKPLRKSVA
jgi:hypothetical protein